MQNYKSVLIVEDDEILAQSLEKSFIRRGYETKIANSSREASEVLKKFHPQYAVVDLKMPGESGLEFIKKLHEFDENIKIVMLTGYASITTTIEAIKAGACYYLAKPANVEDIIKAFNDEQTNIIKEKKTSIKNLEWEYIHQTLVETDFNISKAAKLLGMHRRTLSRKLEKRRVS
ncbi:MAG: response regulator transcription factor [Pelagibacterales bacterium]|nr:response regulator transcription factor [Pelagibacterales bacterium]